jgi:hypothetical protein
VEKVGRPGVVEEGIGLRGGHGSGRLSGGNQGKQHGDDAKADKGRE